jgi:uncharacterized protein
MERRIVMDFVKTLAAEFSLGTEQTEKTIELLDDGNTIPFIARYRKEVTGGIDDQVLRKLSDRLTQLRAVEERRADIMRLIEEQGSLTNDLKKQIESAGGMTALEDIYRPFRPKRKTRASVAREKGLEPLADALLNASIARATLERIAESSVSVEKGIADKNEAFAGASDIIAERLSDLPELRARLRGLMKNTGKITTKARKNETSVYEQYYDYNEPVSRAAGHRILAVNRGEKEEFLSVSLGMDDELALTHIRSFMPQINPATVEYLIKAAEDAWKRLILPSISSDLRAEMTERAEDEAMRIFSQNLKNLLMIPPMRSHTVLALDPAYRTGCKLAVIDPTGRPLYTGVIFPTPPQNRIKESADEVDRLCRQFKVTLIAFGNGTASRETERFIAETITEKGLQVKTYMVNEAGASVYSASELAAAEFPELDLTKRSAISIGRRLQDPLAELVKIDPKAIGVGQYQHDMNPKKLEHTLGGVVESCVNEVGADVNTASASLLSYIAGINKPIAKNIVEYRETNGPFASRTELLKVARLGPKVYKQCAGFLRVPGGKDPLDDTRIHPESYSIARSVAAAKKTYDPEALAAKLSVGLPTLLDIVAALEDPGFDPRSELAQPELLADVLEISDLREGMMLTGVVRNVSAFGAFIDIGVHQDGLVHVSEMADRFVTDPFSVVKVGQTVRIRVLSVDTIKKRISLSMKGLTNT